VNRTVERMAVVLALLSMAAAAGWSQQQGEPGLREPHTAIPLYRITFKESEAVKGVAAAPAFRLPFHCSSDGAVFITTVQPARPDAQPKDVLGLNQFLLISVSPSGEAHSFPLNRVTDLYGLHQISEAPSESRVVFLVSAAAENRPEKDRDGDPGGRRESARGLPERHDYLIMFDRDGNYQKKIQLESAFSVTHVSPFSSGPLLVYGYDPVDHSPKLAMLKDDGSLLKFLEIPKGDAPESVLGTKDGSGKGSAAYLAAAQFVPQGQYVYFLQAKSDYPILRVSIGGAIEPIKPKLPDGAKIAALIPSDENLYAIVQNADASGKPKEESILELDALDGAVLRQFQVGGDESAYELACVHDKKFLLFHHGEGQLIPLVGTAQPASETAHAAAGDH